MLDFQQKRKIRGVMYSRVTLVILGIIVVFALHSTWSVYKKKSDSGRAAKQSLQDVEELRVRDAELQSKINKLETRQGVEEEIRSKFSVVRQDEQVVIVIDEEASSTEEIVDKGGFFDKIGLWLRDIF